MRFGCRSGSRSLKARDSLATEPHEIELLFLEHCRMELAWPSFDFAVDVTAVYEHKLEALTVYESVFSGSQAELLEKYTTEDRYIGSLVGVPLRGSLQEPQPIARRRPGGLCTVTIRLIPGGSRSGRPSRAAAEQLTSEPQAAEAARPAAPTRLPIPR